MADADADGITGCSLLVVDALEGTLQGRVLESIDPWLLHALGTRQSISPGEQTSVSPGWQSFNSSSSKPSRLNIRVISDESFLEHSESNASQVSGLLTTLRTSVPMSTILSRSRSGMATRAMAVNNRPF